MGFGFAEPMLMKSTKTNFGFEPQRSFIGKPKPNAALCRVVEEPLKENRLWRL
jgi:hypothetical protein